MPYERGRRNSIIERFADGRNRNIFRRLVDRTNYKFYPNELQSLEFAARGSEQRLPLFTIIFVDPHASREVSPFTSPLPDVWRKNFEFVSPSKMDDHESPSAQLFFMVGLQAANTDSSRLNSSYISSEASSSGQSESWNKLSTSLFSSSSTPLLGCLTSGNSSGSVSDNPNAVGSDFLVNDFPKVDKRVKRNPRRKGKKKGKQYKRTASRNVLTEPNVHCDKNINSASAFETSTHSSLSSSGKPLLDNNLSDEATPPGLLVTDVTVEKENSTNNIFVDCSTTLLSCTSYSDEMDDFEQVPSPQRFAGDGLGCNITTSLNSSCKIKDAEMVPFTFDGSTKENHFKEHNIGHDNFSSISMNNNCKVSVVDSSLNGWNSEIGENSNDEIAMQLVKDESRPSSSEGEISEIISPSEEPIQCDTSSYKLTVNLCNLDTEISKDCYSSDAYLSNDVLDACSSTERADCNNQAGSSNDFHPVISGKRGRRSRRMIGNGSSNGGNRSITANIHCHIGKDNNYSIWQKVQKIDRNEYVSKSNNGSIFSPHSEDSAKDTKMKMKPNKFVGLKQKQSGLTYRYPCLDAVSKIEPSQVASRGPKIGQTLSKSTVGNSVNSVKSKSSLVVRPANQYRRNGSYMGKSEMPNTPKHHFQQRDGMQNSPHANLNNYTGLRSLSDSFAQRCLSKPTDSVDCCQTEPEKATHVLMEEATPSRNVCNGVCHWNLPAAHSEIGHMPTTSNQFGQRQIEANSESGSTKNSKDTQNDLSIVGIEDHHGLKPDIESYRESSSLGSSGTPIQKWVPVGRKDSAVSVMGNLDCLKVSVIDESAINQSYSKVAEVEDSSSSNSLSTPKDGEFSYPGANELPNRLSSYPPSTEVLDLHAVINCQTQEMKDKECIGFETDLEKIRGAVIDAYKLQSAVEGVQLVTGSPVADFEKFLFSASPVIGQTQCSRSCDSCSPEQLIGNSLSCHQIPNISLKSIWQWYEDSGCFGLEVKAYDFCNSRRLQNGRFEFTAYFVPYLSAVQLFGTSRSTRYCNLSGQAAITCEADKSTKSLSSLPSLPILSMLLPQPCKDIGACLLESSSSAEDEFFAKGIHIGHEELIFEYFESDQPPWRRPLHEKIKELVTSDTLSDRRIFGDPLKLESIKLHDLHPASWYGVAWYPIYRIPDGSFHAAFLTYHSLGHYVHRSAPGSVPGTCKPLVSPVVGLQTYNDKGENWFQLRDMDLKAVQSEDAHYSNTSELIKERVRMLKQTAAVMARAVVSKGNQRSVNWHPDYEFFVSRSR